MIGADQLRRRARKAALIGLAGGLLYVLVGPGAGPPAAGEQVTSAPTLGPLHPDGALEPAPAPTGPAAAAADAAASDDAYALPAAQIDPSKAVVDGDHLVQVMDDGTRIELTLDPMLQRAAERSLERYKVEYGVLVAIRPQTGEILALAEHAEHRPELRHLALQAEGPAASLFKLITASALLELTDLQPSDSICTHGGLKGVGLEHLRANTTLDTRCRTFADALGASDNPAFARWADQLLRPPQLQAMADRFLFNRRLPFLWGVAVSRARIPTGSRLGFARSAAGFEGSQLSPLHAALIAAAIANDGDMMVPRLVARAVKDGAEVYRAEPARLTRVLTPDIARRLRAMMVATTTTGTGKKFFEKGGQPRLPVAVAGKTGSLAAQDTGVARHYSWFVGIGPAETPEIAVASLVVNGDEWTVKGIVPARELLETYFKMKETGPAASR